MTTQSCSNKRKSSMPEVLEPQQDKQERVLQPRKFDILCGKDKQCVGHVGSKRFRAVIESYRHRYSLTKTKYEKMMITKEIYERLDQESCRFLRFNNSTMTWEELPTMAARDKVGHALRFANRTTRRRRKSQTEVPDDACSMKSWESVEPATITRTVTPPTHSKALVDKDSSVLPLPELQKKNQEPVVQESVIPLASRSSTTALAVQPEGERGLDVWDMPITPSAIKLHEAPVRSAPRDYCNMSPTKLSREHSINEGLLSPRHTYYHQNRQPHYHHVETKSHQGSYSPIVYPPEVPSQQQHMDEVLMPLLQEPIMDWDLDFEISPAIFAA